MLEPHLTLIFWANARYTYKQLRSLLDKLYADGKFSSPLNLSFISVPTIEEAVEVRDRMRAEGKTCYAIGPMPPEEEEVPCGTTLCQ